MKELPGYNQVVLFVTCLWGLVMRPFIPKNEFAELVRRCCLEFGEFNLSSGVKSKFYLDLRKLTLSVGVYHVSVVLGRHLRDLEIPFDSIGGPETGVNQILGALLCHEAGYPMDKQKIHRAFVVRKESKDHGKQGLLVGNILPGDRVVLLDDVVTSGNSILKAKEVVESVGGKVVLVTCLVDRGNQASKVFSDLGILYEPILTLKDLGIPYDNQG